MKKQNSLKNSSNFCHTLYACDLVIKSQSLNHLKIWLLLVFNHLVVPQKCSVKRFTLLRSPLGNKRSKDQFEFKEWSVSMRVESQRPSFILYFCQIVLLPVGLKTKINLLKFKKQDY